MTHEMQDGGYNNISKFEQLYLKIWETTAISQSFDQSPPKLIAFV